MDTEVVEVESVKSLGKQNRDVYDVGMQGHDKVFFANNLLLHNSVFFPALPIIEKEFKDIDTDDFEDMTEAILEIADRVQAYLNNCYNHFADKFLNANDWHKDSDGNEINHRLDIKQELIARAGLWIVKKRYAQWIINDEGDPTDEFDVKGIDIVRSDFPEAFSSVLEDVIYGTLKGKTNDEINSIVLDFEDQLYDLKADDIARPTGVNKVEQYSTGEFGVREKGTPIHVKSALSYNDLLEHYDIHHSFPPIKSGDKIKWLYLENNPLGLTECAFTGSEDPPEIMQFIDKYVNYDKMHEKLLKTKLESIYDALGWDWPSRAAQNMNKFF